MLKSETRGPLGSTVGAGGLRVRLPTGDPAQGLGTGYGGSARISCSRRAYSTAGSTHTGRWAWTPASATPAGARRTYRWALDVHAPRGPEWWTRLALAWEVLGRSEFTSLRQPSSISGPHVTEAGVRSRPYLGIDADRHDYVDTTLGVRVRLVKTIVLSLGVFKALNDQGVRPAAWSPVASVQGTF